LFNLRSHKKKKEGGKKSGAGTYLKSNSDSRPGVVLSITGFSNIPPPPPPPLPETVADIDMRIPRLAHGPLQTEFLSPTQKKKRKNNKYWQPSLCPKDIPPETQLPLYSIPPVKTRTSRRKPGFIKEMK
jgi:hypothetical protein